MCSKGVPDAFSIATPTIFDVVIDHSRFGLLNEVGVGEFKDWRAFIMRDPRAASNFPLKVAHPIFLMGASHYLLFADRDRWTERNN